MRLYLEILDLADNIQWDIIFTQDLKLDPTNYVPVCLFLKLSSLRYIERKGYKARLPRAWVQGRNCVTDEMVESLSD